MASKTPVGFIGLGNMGSHMAKNLLKHGYPVFASDIFPESCKEIQDLGAQVLDSPAEVADRADRIITMLPSSPNVIEVYTGLKGILKKVKKGSLLIDSSTIDPSVSKEMAKEAEKMGAVFMDAPVSGGVDVTRLPASPAETGTGGLGHIFLFLGELESGQMRPGFGKAQVLAEFSRPKASMNCNRTCSSCSRVAASAYARWASLFRLWLIEPETPLLFMLICGAWLAAAVVPLYCQTGVEGWPPSCGSCPSPLRPGLAAPSEPALSATLSAVVLVVFTPLAQIAACGRPPSLWCHQSLAASRPAVLQHYHRRLVDQPAVLLGCGRPVQHSTAQYPAASDRHSSARLLACSQVISMSSSRRHWNSCSISLLVSPSPSRS
ncbi:3HIDH protein, partial [Polyodon spathula]|nr:3HIDH protein [Polyodon spathula]